MPDSGTARLSNRKSKTVQNEKRPGTLVRTCSGALFFVDKQSAVADIITHKGLQQIVAVNAANQRTGVLVSSDLGTDLFTEGEDGSNRESYNKYATQLNPDDGILYEMWENHYKGISDANIAMQKIRDSQDLLESVKIQSYAEMQFIRAYLYFDLVQQFGRIPLVTEGSFEIRTDFKRAPIADVYSVIISDLRNAAENLPEKASVLLHIQSW